MRAGTFAWCVVLAAGLLGACSPAPGDSELHVSETNPQVLYADGVSQYVSFASAALSEQIQAIEKNENMLPFKDAAAIRVIFMTDPDQFEAITGVSREARSGLVGNDIYLLEPSFGLPNQVRQALTWQLVRLYVYQHAGAFRSRVIMPDWFVTGTSLAVSGGGASNEWVMAREADEWVRQGMSFFPVPYRGLWAEESPEALGLTQAMYNTQTKMFATFLISKNEAAFHQVVKHSFDTNDFGLLWRQYYGQTLRQLWADYNEILRTPFVPKTVAEPQS
jgi:hypothetical protein